MFFFFKFKDVFVPVSQTHALFLFAACREEAQRVWEKREAEWEKERRARERLMREVRRC